MSNQCQFIRLAAAVLMACGLIGSLLPGLAVAQDLSTVETRAARVIEQRRGESINFNAKFGAAIALARLALDPDDAEVIDRITHFYDRVPAGSNGQQFSYPGVAWVLGRYWDKFTPEQRDHLKARLKTFSDLLGHGTENPPHSKVGLQHGYSLRHTTGRQQPLRNAFESAHHSRRPFPVPPPPALSRPPPSGSSGWSERLSS